MSHGLAKDPGNARSLDLYQKIYDESDHLSSYNKVDENLEWSNFKQSVQTTVSDNELLQYLDGMSNAQERAKVDAWKKASSKNEEEFEIFNLIIRESSQLTNYKRVNEADEWSSFSELLKAPKAAPLTVVKSPETEQVEPSTPSVPAVAVTTTGATEQAREVPMVQQQKEKERSGMPFLYRVLAIAASILLLSVFAWSLWQNNSSSLDNQTEYLTYSTEDYPEVITISDGTIISLDERTTLTYFKDVNDTEERSVTIDGTGEFNVASNPDKPFVLKAERSGCRYQGSRYKVSF